jgi:6-phosphofructokinase 1
VTISGSGFPVVAVPKTMDNDVNGTDYCIGFSTAVSRGVEFVHALRTTAGSHERIAVIELVNGGGNMCHVAEQKCTTLAG